MEWNDLIELILNSIQIIGIFIAIIIGLIISKVMDLKKEKSEIMDAIDDIDNELDTLNEQFKKMQEDNYSYYKEDNVFDIVDSLLEQREYQFNENIPYVSIEYQKDFYNYVEKYMHIIAEKCNDNISIEDCKKQLDIKEDSVEEVIAEEIYDWRYEDEF